MGKLYDVCGITLAFTEIHIGLSHALRSVLGKLMQGTVQRTGQDAFYILFGRYSVKQTLPAF